MNASFVQYLSLWLRNSIFRTLAPSFLIVMLVVVVEQAVWQMENESYCFEMENIVESLGWMGDKCFVLLELFGELG